jgi:hypothetical protein
MALDCRTPRFLLSAGRTLSGKEEPLGHPWELTVRQLVRQVRRDYGIELRLLTMARGAALEQGNLIYYLPGMDEDDLAPLEVLETICRVFRLPREDFGLDPADD